MDSPDEILWGVDLILCWLEGGLRETVSQPVKHRISFLERDCERTPSHWAATNSLSGVGGKHRAPGPVSVVVQPLHQVHIIVHHTQPMLTEHRKRSVDIVIDIRFPLWTPPPPHSPLTQHSGCCFFTRSQNSVRAVYSTTTQFSWGVLCSGSHLFFVSAQPLIDQCRQHGCECSGTAGSVRCATGTATRTCFPESG